LEFTTHIAVNIKLVRALTEGAIKLTILAEGARARYRCYPYCDHDAINWLEIIMLSPPELNVSSLNDFGSSRVLCLEHTGVRVHNHVISILLAKLKSHNMSEVTFHLLGGMLLHGQQVRQIFETAIIILLKPFKIKTMLITCYSR